MQTIIDIIRDEDFGIIYTAEDLQAVADLEPNRVLCARYDWGRDTMTAAEAVERGVLSNESLRDLNLTDDVRKPERLRVPVPDWQRILSL